MNSDDNKAKRFLYSDKVGTLRHNLREADERATRARCALVQGLKAELLRALADVSKRPDADHVALDVVCQEVRDLFQQAISAAARGQVIVACEKVTSAEYMAAPWVNESNESSEVEV